MTQTLLVVDDEPEFLRTLATNLRGAGYAVETAGSVEAALGAAKGTQFDAVVLDLVLPDGTGTDVCAAFARGPTCRSWSSRRSARRRRRSTRSTPAQTTTSSSRSRSAELLARLRAVLRRVGASTEPILRVGPLEIDREGRAVTRNGDLVHLTPHEFDLLRVLGEHEGKLMTHARILREVWGPGYQRESNYLHVYVSQLRRKIEADPARPQLLLTAPGLGYRLVAPQS